MKIKKVKKFIKNNIKVVIAFILGGIIIGTGGAYAATVLSSKDVTYSNTSSGLSATTVQGAIDEIYEKAKSTEFKVGDYVSMTPTKTTFTVPMTLTGYTSNQTINPSELKLWKVIRINSDKTVDMVSEYVSSVNVYFSGQTGYQNYIGTLNYIAKQYENQKYTSGSRYMGYNGTQTEYITDTSALTSPTAPQTSETSSSNVTSATESQGLGDMGYETDYNLVNTALGTLVANKVGTITATVYWLASHGYYYNSSAGWSFDGRYINASGGLRSYGLYNYLSGGFNTYSVSGAVRPILTLKSGVKASSGNGSSSSPYVLS